MVYFQAMTATADTGGVGYDEGLRSTAENPKRLLSVLVQVTEIPLVSSMLQIWYEKEKIAELPLNLINSPLCTDTNTPYGMNVINEVEVGFDIPIGAIVKVAVKAVGGTQTIIGAYRYEITA